ncbi:MAG: PQQ-like beta-propeller repeat protein [Anaerolineae bacterium]|nr:PQQ-like beta-propeller repeat protein [Anaerolineae bacterium]
MKKSRILILLSILGLSVALSACGIRVPPSSWPGITVSEDSVYVAYGPHVYSLQLNNGLERWRFPEKADNGTTYYAVPALSEDGQLFFGSYGRNSNAGNVFYSVDPANGQQNWSFDNGGNRYIASPLVTDEAIFLPNADGKLYELSLSGAPDGSFETGDSLWAKPASNGELLFVSSMDHVLYAIDAGSKAVRWSQDLGGAVVSTPTIGPDGNLYVGTFAGEVLALNSKSGKVIWRITTQDWVWGSPELVDGTLYVGDLGGNFYALEAKSGKQVWKFEAEGAITGHAVVVGESIYFLTEAGHIYALNLDGTIKWKNTPIEEAKFYGSPVAVGGLLLIGVVNADAILLAVNLDGSQQWLFEPKK